MSDTEIKELEPAPDFTLPAIGSDNVVKDGQVQLSALRGHTIVLYFYPKTTPPAVQPKRALSAMPIMLCRSVGLLCSV